MILNLNEFFKRLKYIARLLVTTPYYPWIILINLFTTALTVVGIPMLLPAFEYLKLDGDDEKSHRYTKYIEGMFDILGVETNFFSFVIFAAAFICAAQLMLLAIELINKRIQIKMIKFYLHELISNYYLASWEWISNDLSGKFHSSVSREVIAASEAHLDSQRLFTSLLQAVAYIFIAATLSINITLWSAFFFSFIVLINVSYADNIKDISSQFNQASISLSSFISSLTQNRKFFKATIHHTIFTNVVLEKVREVYTKNWDLTLIDSILKTFTTMAGLAFVISIFLFHSFLNVTVPELLLILLVFNRMAPHFIALSGNFIRISEKIPLHQSVGGRIEELKTNREVTGGENFDSRNSICFEDVSFGYSKDQMVLRNVDVEIKPLRTTAFVGGSGAGKSTLLDLFLGLLKPDSGVLYYGEIHSHDLNIAILRSKVAYVSQETTLIDGSLLYNLTITNPEASEAEVKDACSKAQISEMINELPDGLDTEIGENGIKISGGQRQRVALGRALMSNPDILILDEATSQLDSETEHFIQQAIKGLHKKLTIIIVAHRMSTVRFADTVYVLEKGIIAEHGTYEELLEQKGRLYELDVLQH